MKRILIITYYWPPAGGSGVQRWLKFVKYLTQNNFHCIVYTPQNPERPVIDHSFAKDIPTKNFQLLQTKITEPYSIYKLFTGKSSKEKITVSFLNENKRKNSISETISKFIRANVFIPDAKMLWIKPSVKFLSQYIKKNPVDVVISTGPPHSLHVIGMKLKQTFPHLKFIADFRDPWTNIDFMNELPLTSFAKKLHRKLEKQVVKTADVVISVSPTLSKELSLLDPENKNKFYTITNGFDEEDLKEISQNNTSEINKTHIVLTYAGLIPSNRNPHVLWNALFDLKKENKIPDNFKIQLIGKTDASITEHIRSMQLESLIEQKEYLPHQEVLKLEHYADALLLIVNNSVNSKGILTGKLFEYLALQKPIIAICPTDGDAAKIIYETNSGVVVDYNDTGKMKDVLIKLFHHQLPVPDKEKIQQYSRQSLTKELIKIIHSI